MTWDWEHIAGVIGIAITTIGGIIVALIRGKQNPPPAPEEKPNAPEIHFNSFNQVSEAFVKLQQATQASLDDTRTELDEERKRRREMDERHRVRIKELETIVRTLKGWARLAKERYPELPDIPA